MANDASGARPVFPGQIRIDNFDELLGAKSCDGPEIFFKRPFTALFNPGKPFAVSMPRYFCALDGLTRIAVPKPSAMCLLQTSRASPPTSTAWITPPPLLD